MSNEIKSDLFEKISNIIIKEKGCITDKSIQQLVKLLRDKAKKQQQNINNSIKKEPFTSKILRSITNAATKYKTTNEHKEKSQIEEITEKMSECIIQERGEIIEKDILEVENHLKCISSQQISNSLQNYEDKTDLAKDQNSNIRLKGNSVSNITLTNTQRHRLTQSSSSSAKKVTSNNDTIVNTGWPKNRGNTRSLYIITQNNFNITAVTKSIDKYTLRNCVSSVSQKKMDTVTPDQIQRDFLLSSYNHPFTEEGNNGKRNDRKNWKSDKRIIVMMNDNFSKSLVTIENKDTATDCTSNPIHQLYCKTADTILLGIPELTASDVEKISKFLQNYVGRKKRDDCKTFNVISPSMPTWALRGFLENDNLKSIIKITGSLLEKMVDYIINERGEILVSDVKEFCTELMKKHAKSKETNDKNKLAEKMDALRQARLRYKQAEIISTPILNDCSRSLKHNCLRETGICLRVENLDNTTEEQSKADNLFASQQKTPCRHKSCINAAIMNSIISFEYIKGLSDQLMVNDVNEKSGSETEMNQSKNKLKDPSAFTNEMTQCYVSKTKIDEIENKNLQRKHHGIHVALENINKSLKQLDKKGISGANKTPNMGSKYSRAHIPINELYTNGPSLLSSFGQSLKKRTKNQIAPSIIGDERKNSVKGNINIPNNSLSHKIERRPSVVSRVRPMTTNATSLTPADNDFEWVVPVRLIDPKSSKSNNKKDNSMGQSLANKSGTRTQSPIRTTPPKSSQPSNCKNEKNITKNSRNQSPLRIEHPKSSPFNTPINSKVTPPIDKHLRTTSKSNRDLTDIKEKQIYEFKTRSNFIHEQKDKSSTTTQINKSTINTKTNTNTKVLKVKSYSTRSLSANPSRPKTQPSNCAELLKQKSNEDGKMKKVNEVNSIASTTSRTMNNNENKNADCTDTKNNKDDTKSHSFISLKACRTYSVFKPFQREHLITTQCDDHNTFHKEKSMSSPTSRENNILSNVNVRLNPKCKNEQAISNSTVTSKIPIRKINNGRYCKTKSNCNQLTH